jgi:DNA-binding MarR family transcriptional regulator
MAAKTADEIRQKKPFRNPESEAFVSLVRTADTLVRQVDRLLKPYGLTMTQYNALRILRGAGGEGATCSYIAERLITNDPDVTRLLDRLEKSSLIERSRSTTDRRIVLSRLTKAGSDVLDRLDREVDDLHARQFAGVGRKSLATMLDQLATIRTSEEPRS